MQTQPETRPNVMWWQARNKMHENGYGPNQVLIFFSRTTTAQAGKPNPWSHPTNLDRTGPQSPCREDPTGQWLKTISSLLHQMQSLRQQATATRLRTSQSIAIAALWWLVQDAEQVFFCRNTTIIMGLYAVKKNYANPSYSHSICWLSFFLYEKNLIYILELSQKSDF